MRNDADEALYSYNADIGKVKLITLPDNGNIVKIQFWKSGFAGTLRVRIWLLDDGCKMIYDTLRVRTGFSKTGWRRTPAA